MEMISFKVGKKEKDTEPQEKGEFSKVLQRHSVWVMKTDNTGPKQGRETESKDSTHL